MQMETSELSICNRCNMKSSAFERIDTRYRDRIRLDRLTQSQTLRESSALHDIELGQSVNKTAKHRGSTLSISRDHSFYLFTTIC